MVSPSRVATGADVAGVVARSRRARSVRVIRASVATVADPPRERPGARRRGVRRGPAVGDGRPPRPIATVERHGQPVTHDPQSIADRLEQPPIVRHHQQRGGRFAHERLDRLARRDVEVVRRLVEQQQVRWLDAEQRELEPRPLATGQRANLLERVVATEQEAGEIRARLAGRDRDRVEQRVEHGRARDRGEAQLRQVPDLDRIAERQRAVERRQVTRDRAQQRGLAGAVRPDDPDPIAPLCREERCRDDDPGERRRPAVGVDGATTRQEADGEVLDANDDLPGP